MAAALDQARAFVAAGAEILDVGAESSRPARRRTGSIPRSTPRRKPVWRSRWSRRLAAELGEQALISIDTTKGDVARAALAAGAGMVNDVWAARRDPGTADAAAAAGAYLVVMHNKDVAEYPDGVLPEVHRLAAVGRRGGRGAGVARDRHRGRPRHRLREDNRSTASRCSIGCAS